jgi:hypothetical protein
MLHTLFVSTLVSAAILPALHTLAVLEIILPVSFVLGAVDVDIDTISVGFVFFPLSFINVTISMPELSSAVGFVLSPFTLVFGVVRPYLDSWSMSHVVQEVSFVDGSILKSELFDELVSHLDRVLLKIDEVLVLSLKKSRHIILADGLCRDWLILIFVT